MRTARINKSLYDPYTNLLRATTEALSAAIGGCDRLAVEAFGFDEHLAVNVQRILKEESLIDAVADPAGGSYYVEALTDALARAAWTEFQQVEAEGGFAAALAAGTIPGRLAASRAAREAAVSSRRRTLVGVNNYPDLNREGASHRAPARRRGRRLAAGRAARGHSQAHRAVRPQRRACSARAAPDARRRARCSGARANFCLNFFGCGGFDIEQSDQYADHGADLIVLCSSDPEYLPFAHGGVRRGAGAGARRGQPEGSGRSAHGRWRAGDGARRQRHRADAHRLAGCALAEGLLKGKPYRWHVNVGS